jgi:hypothetical protein
MKLFIILAILATSCYAGDFDGIVLRFFGTSYGNYQNLTITGNFSAINGTYFNETLLSVLIIHGREENYTSDVVKELYSAFATRPNYNIILADYGANSSDNYLKLMWNLNNVSRTASLSVSLSVCQSVSLSVCQSVQYPKPRIQYCLNT